MASLNKTVIMCEHRKVLETLDRTIPCIERDGAKLNSDDGALIAWTLKGVPYQRVKEVSLLFPDDPITCRYSFNVEDFNTVHTCRYLAGEETYVGIEPNYHIYSFPMENEQDKIAVEEKILALSQSLDKVKQGENGEWAIEWLDGEVEYTFEYSGSEKTYKIVTKKRMHHLDTRVYIKTEGIVWDPLKPSSCDNDDLPM